MPNVMQKPLGIGKDKPPSYVPNAPEGDPRVHDYPHATINNLLENIHTWLKKCREENDANRVHRLCKTSIDYGVLNRLQRSAADMNETCTNLKKARREVVNHE